MESVLFNEVKVLVGSMRPPIQLWIGGEAPQMCLQSVEGDPDWVDSPPKHNGKPYGKSERARDYVLGIYLRLEIFEWFCVVMWAFRTPFLAVFR